MIYYLNKNNYYQNVQQYTPPLLQEQNAQPAKLTPKQEVAQATRKLIPIVRPQPQTNMPMGPMLPPGNFNGPQQQHHMPNPYAHPMNRPSNMSGQNPLLGFMVPSHMQPRNTVSTHSGSINMNQNIPFGPQLPPNPGMMYNPIPPGYLKPNPHILDPNYGQQEQGPNSITHNFNPESIPVPKEGDTYTVNDQNIEQYGDKTKFK